MKIVASAPLRLPLGGGGTDLPWYASRRGGFLVAAAIRSRVRVTLEVPDRGRQTTAMTKWMREALRHLDAPRGVTARVESSIPPGSGLGGSGAVLVALGHALARLRGEPSNARQLAEQAYRVEHDRMGCPIGKQDPYVAAYGGIIELKIARDGSVRVRQLSLSSATRGALEETLLLVDTRGRRRAATILEEQQRAARRSVRLLRSMDSIRAIGLRMARHLERGHLSSIGKEFNEHWGMKRTLSAGTSTVAAELCLSLGLEAGARGGKLIGAGGGGFVLLDCGRARSRVLRALAASGFRGRRVRLDPAGSRAWLLRARTGRAA